MWNGVQYQDYQKQVMPALQCSYVKSEISFWMPKDIKSFKMFFFSLFTSLKLLKTSTRNCNVYDTTCSIKALVVLSTFCHHIDVAEIVNRIEGYNAATPAH